MFKIEVYCQLDFEAIHNFPDAEKLCNQWYLANLHRHMFRIKCTWEAVHGDREKEFIDVQHSVRAFLNKQFPNTVGNLKDIGTFSCETLAMLILANFDFLKIVEVSEDGENGAIVTKILKQSST